MTSGCAVGGCYCVGPTWDGRAARGGGEVAQPMGGTAGRHSADQPIRVPERRRKPVRGAMLLIRGLEVVVFAAVVAAAVAVLAHPLAVGGPSEESSYPMKDPSSGAFSIEDVAAKALPSVVTLQFNDGDNAQLGSGVIITADGLIMTNNHVVAPIGDRRQPPERSTVTLNDGRTAPFELIATDPKSDIAIGRVHLSGLTPMSISSSVNLRVGQRVAAVGSPLGLRGTVTAGIVSALNRLICPATAADGPLSAYYAIQTDAAINPGNSGGALVDMNGALVGINAAEAVVPGTESAAVTAHGSIGLNYAIPIDHATRIVAELVATGRASHGWLGVRATTDARGAIVTEVASGSPASDAGLTAGTLITKVDDQFIRSGDTLIAAVQSKEPGAAVTLSFTAPGRPPATAQITLGSDQGKQ